MKVFLLLFSGLFFSSFFAPQLNTTIPERWRLLQASNEAGDSLHFSKPQELILDSGRAFLYFASFSVNTCSAELRFLPKGKLFIGSIACTEKCCDTDNEISFMRLFSSMESYRFMQDTLYLEGEQKYILRFKEMDAAAVSKEIRMEGRIKMLLLKIP